MPTVSAMGFCYAKKQEGDDMANINSTLQKIKALANGTSNVHEREAALKKLHELMELHGISEADLESDDVQTHIFKWRNKRERHLLTQVILKVMDCNDLTTYAYRRGGRKIAGEMGLDCTVAQKLEIDFMFSFYKDLYRREEEAFYSAFIQKHKIYGPLSGKGKELSNAEFDKMRQLMSGMDDASPQKRIAVEE